MLNMPALGATERAIRPAVLLFLFHMACSTTAQAREIWLAGVGSVVEHDGQANGPSSDFVEMFRPQAPWTRAATHVSVFKVVTQFVLGSSDRDLSAVFSDLKRRNIALAVELGMLFGDMGCGKGIEGYAHPTTAATVARRIRSLGGELKYVALDEQLYFGHDYGGPNSCKFPIAEVARRVAVHVREMRQVFPMLQVGDIEPIGSLQPKDRVDEIMQWVAAYRAEMGEPLAFVHADVQWGQPWEQELRLLAGSLHSARVAFGIIYNGDGSDTTGIAWARHAEERFAAVETDPELVPDQAILQSWMPQPAQNLPEMQPGTMTYLINRYAASPSRISVQRADAGIAGRMTDGASNPIERATVQVLAVANAKTDIMVMRKLTDVVPPGAASATIGVRINDECGCSGPANVAIGTVVYHDNRSGQTVQRQFGQTGGTMASVSRFVAAAGQKIGRNTPGFPVTPGDQFTIEVPLSASYDTAGHGVVTIIFLNQEGKGTSRRSLPFQPSTEPVGTTVTDASGRFVLPVNPALRNSNPSYLAEFDGNDQYRRSSSLMP